MNITEIPDLFKRKNYIISYVKIFILFIIKSFFSNNCVFQTIGKENLYKI